MKIGLFGTNIGRTQVFRTFGSFSSVFDASFKDVVEFFEAETSAPNPVIKLETHEGL
jgi:hypothetical protein